MREPRALSEPSWQHRAGERSRELFLGVYEEGMLPNGAQFTKLFPGTLVQLTDFGLVETEQVPREADSAATDASTR